MLHGSANRMSNWFKLLVSAILSLLAMGPWCLAATPPAGEKSAESGELRFRRVFFPEGMTAWPKGNVKYLPMEADEFERLWVAIQRTAPGPLAQTAVGLVEAQYDARLAGQALLQGSATLNVSQSVASAMLMTLDPCNLAIARAQWITSDGAPAVLGITSDGKLQVLAERSGQMKFDWSLVGQRDAAGGASFTLALPPSPVNRLRIELPAELTPTVDHGIVTDEGPTDLGLHRWRLELGGRSGCRLRLAKAGSEEARPQTTLASQATSYDFSLRGIELLVKLNIEAGHDVPPARQQFQGESSRAGLVGEPLRKLVLSLDPSLELVEVSAGEVPLTWNVVAGGRHVPPARQQFQDESSRAGLVGDEPRQATIELPPTREAGATSLRLRAIAALSTLGMGKLPRITVAGVVCRTGTIRLSVQSPLCIERLETHGCRQTGGKAEGGRRKADPPPPSAFPLPPSAFRLPPRRASN